MARNATLRQNLVFFFFILFGLLIAGKLVNLQIIKGEYYKALAEGQNTSGQDFKKDRGEIFLKNSEPFAIDKNFSLVFANGLKISDPQKTAQSLSSVLGLPEDFVLAQIGKDTLYSPIKSRLTKEEIKGLEELNLSGISFTREQGHYFPQETLASQVVGFVDANYQGQYGLEEYYNDLLSGRKPATDKGSSLVLTIDYDIQFMAEKLLETAKKNVDMESGSILVLDPNSGKILAMANYPNFNPNGYRDYAQAGDMGIFQNNLTQKIFEPGSVFKPITMAAALEEEAITPQTTYTDEGIIKIGGRTIYNYDNRTYGLQTMTNVLEKSINTGAVFAQRQLGNSLFLKYIENFGFFSSTGVDLQEVYSENREFKKGYEINYATAAFGQGIEITPIQLARAFSAIANGGKLVKPYLVEKISTPQKDGSSRDQETKPEFSKPVISSKTASQVTTMLTSVVENGFSKKAKIPGYYIAGKTGTAQVPEAGKYSSDRTVQSFIGFFPAF
ncbi:MAG: penicillin-binding protein 2, partial [bacterium]|nr:penicillin-binding protein 2 [bacterium]